MPDIAELPLVCSFSGGESSALMTKLVNEKFKGKRQIINIMANTTKETKKCLEFARKVDEYLGLNLVLIEAVAHPEHGKASTHKVTTFDEARCNGEAFEEMIAVYGIPNAAFPHCTRELKTNPIRSYLKSIGIDNYVTAIGYRADEPARIKWEKARLMQHYYPLAETWRVNKRDVRDFWKKQPFQLGLKEHEGNCDMCWKKSKNKHLTLITEQPHLIQWWGRMEEKYGMFSAGRDTADHPPPYTFFRNGESAKDLIEDSKYPFDKFVDQIESQCLLFGGFNDLEDNGCGSGSCEPELGMLAA